jgi:DNA-binding response OmpR family regulator
MEKGAGNQPEKAGQQEETIRVAAVFRKELTLGRCIFWPDISKLITPSKTIRLSLREVQILTILADHINIPLSRQKILLHIWGDDSRNNSRNLDVYIRKLRGYLQEDSALEILTMKGHGYQFNAKMP